jgi:hypothetical protein
MSKLFCTVAWLRSIVLHHQLPKMQHYLAFLCNCNQIFLRLLRTNASIWFNKICQSKELKADCAKIKINSSSAGAHITKEQVNIYRIKMKIIITRKNEHSLNHYTNYTLLIQNTGNATGTLF